MIKYQKVSGVSLSDEANLEKLTISDEGRAMGAVPGWQVLFDPSYAGDGRIRNRAQPSDNAPIITGQASIGQVNGQDVFNQTEEHLIGGHSKGAVNPNAWSVFWCGRADEISGAIPRIVAPLNDDYNEQDDYVLNFAVSSSGHEVLIYQQSGYASGNPDRLSYSPPTQLSNRTDFSLLMATFSTSEGLKIYDGGELVASDPTDTTPLNGALEPGAFRWWRFISGQWGMSGLLNIDLGAPENTGHRRAIEKFLMSKYGIPEGPQ